MTQGTRICIIYSGELNCFQDMWALPVQGGGGWVGNDHPGTHDLHVHTI